MELILKYFSNITKTQQQQFLALEQLYKGWNAKINVVSRKDMDALYVRHVLHSLAIAKFITFKDGTQLLDVGTGGGFPGIPLAIMFPNCTFHLVDSIAKKLKVVNAVSQAINLNNVVTTHQRAETLTSTYHFIISRAVTNMSKFVNWVSNKVKLEDNNAMPNGIIYLKGGDLKDELKPFKDAEVIEISSYFNEPFFDTKKVVYLPL